MSDSIFEQDQHPIDLAVLKDLGVDQFDSETRPIIYEGIQELHRRVKDAKIPGWVWVEGEFSTITTDPDHCTLLFIAPSGFDPNDHQVKLSEWINSKPPSEFLCETYFVFSVAADHPAHQVFQEVCNYVSGVVSDAEYIKKRVGVIDL